VFRNYLCGFRSAFHNQTDNGLIDDINQSGNGPKRCIGAMTYSCWMTFVGNILGTQGKMGGWVYDRSIANGWNAPGIWLLGWDGDKIDTMVKNTAVRDGNWDWVQSKQSWHNSTATALQNSLYLTAKPAFFGSCPWPWVDPVTGAVYNLPAKARFEGANPCQVSVESGLPARNSPELFSLSPNPFNSEADLRFRLAEKAVVNIGLYNLQGKLVETVAFGDYPKGEHTLRLRKTGRTTLTAGCYLMRFSTPAASMIRKIVLLRAF
jgi:hypothetical protein